MKYFEFLILGSSIVSYKHWFVFEFVLKNWSSPGFWVFSLHNVFRLFIFLYWKYEYYNNVHILFIFHTNIVTKYIMLKVWHKIYIEWASLDLSLPNLMNPRCIMLPLTGRSPAEPLLLLVKRPLCHYRSLS